MFGMDRQQLAWKTKGPEEGEDSGCVETAEGERGW